MILQITREDIKELLETRILEKSGLIDRLKNLDEFRVHINEPIFGKKLRYYLYIQIHEIFMAEISKSLDESISLLSNEQVIILHGSVFNTIVNYYIDKYINNKAYNNLEDLESDLFDCIYEIEEDINYITVWE